MTQIWKEDFLRSEIDLSRAIASFRLAGIIACLAIALLIATCVMAGASANALLNARFLVPFALTCLGTFWVFVAWMMPRVETTQIIPSRVRDALDTFHDGLLVLDERERIVVANRAFRDQLQLSSKELIGRKASRLNWSCGHGTKVHDFPWIRTLQNYRHPATAESTIGSSSTTDQDNPSESSSGEASTSEASSTKASSPKASSTKAIVRPWKRQKESRRTKTLQERLASQKAFMASETLLRYQRRDKQLRFLSVSAASIESDDGGNHGVLVTFRDVTQVEEQRADLERMLAVLRANREEISRKNRELEHLANSDALTGCLNRRSFLEWFQNTLSQSEQEKTPLACLMVDNDHFKSVNDTYGHSVGDEVLREVAAALHETFADVGRVCRYGGEEFCILVPQVNLQEAAQHAERARVAIESIRLDDPSELRLSASIGVTATTIGKDSKNGEPTPQTMIDEADKCLYVAKKQGRNQVVTFNDEIRCLSMETLTREDEASDDFEEDLCKIPFHAVMGLVSALAYRDTATAEHSRRVANLCVRAASTLLDQRSTYILEMAALLHDVGKIALPDDVLQKPGPLTPDQWRLVAKHHRIGVEIVSGTFHHEELCTIVRTHLAYYGGRSLIAGLPSGRNIPLAARLLTIADTYDVITSDRPHRAGKGHDHAVAELRRCAGKQFDPVLVEHFIASLGDTPRRQETDAPVVSRQTALQIGLQIERLADAIDSRNLANLRFLATRLHAMAEHHQIDSIANAAQQLQSDAANETLEWISLLENTQHLLDLCRATQDVFLMDSTAPA